MALQIAAVGDGANLGSAVASDTPVTVAGFIKLDNINDLLFHECVGLHEAPGVAGSATYIFIDNRGANAKKAGYGYAANGVFHEIHGTTIISAGWNHIAGRSAANNDHKVYLHGVNEAISTTAVTAAQAVNNTILGAFVDVGGSYFGEDHAVAECAVWNAALTDEEISILSKGYSPAFVRSASLVFYAPVIRTPVNRMGGVLSLTGTASYVDHPRIIMPRPRRTHEFTTVPQTLFPAHFAKRSYVALVTQ